MPKWFTPAALVCADVRGLAAGDRQRAYESTMGLVQKIFYYQCLGVDVSHRGDCLRRRQPAISDLGRGAAGSAGVGGGGADVLFGALALVTGPLWARKAWGVWWQWDVRSPRASWAGWCRPVSDPAAVRRPGSEKLRRLALFGMAKSRSSTFSSTTGARSIGDERGATLPVSMGGRSGSVSRRSAALRDPARMRVRLEESAAVEPSTSHWTSSQ
jgi:hypothetical protein